MNRKEKLVAVAFLMKIEWKKDPDKKSLIPSSFLKEVCSVLEKTGHTINIPFDEFPNGATIEETASYLKTNF